MSCVKSSSVILCEDVRREDTGAIIILGARQNGPAIPKDGSLTVLRMSLYIELELEFPTPKEISIRFWNEESDIVLFEEQIDIGGQVPGDLPEDASEVAATLVVVLKETELEIPCAGIFTVELREDNGDWHCLRRYIFPTANGEMSE